MPIIGTKSDAGKVLLGCPRRGPETVGNYPHDGIVEPGIAGCLNSSGEFVEGAANPLIGISRGKSMNHPDRNSVTQKGKEVPLRLTDLGVKSSGTVTITNVANLLTDVADTVTVGEVVFTAQAGAAVEGEATFQASGSTTNTATSLKNQINAHPDLVDLVLATSDAAEVTIEALLVGEDGDLIALEYSDEGTDTIGATVSGSGFLEGGYESFDYVINGSPVFIDDTTGLATEDDEGATETNWTYDSDVLEGVSQDPSVSATVPCVVVNM